ncbi:alpha/beta hydrolase [Daejeonella lutea]|uniref:Alpha/beta hydrolase family protein n=1 Tax=Daejeonella lutea TaxID=572036 RepID=A0A1T5AJI8_9SPHI|nr:alpha/beta hydrolase [Daejeonella lutea]SKB35168.1 Alpha/beta hydrolase family protein [Daejeonella lutea]
MKKLRSLIKQLAVTDHMKKEELNTLIWEFICYSPQWPVRNHQQQLLDEARKFSVSVSDPHFANRELNVNGYIWGSGKIKILLTHGWGSKAADFYELIDALRQLDTMIISFDAPGNGSSEGELSNLLLYAGAVKAVVKHHGAPGIAIGHSLGAMANAIGLSDTPPGSLINLSPLIRLKENFISSMISQNVSQPDQDYFFQTFNERFDMDPADFNMNDVYRFGENVKHWLAYDSQDMVSPYPYLQDFIQKHPSIQTQNYVGVGHERIIKDERIIQMILELTKAEIDRG